MNVEDALVEKLLKVFSLKSLEDIEKEYLESLKKKAISNTILNLVKLAETLDKENKPEDAEEIHRILRKHTGTQND